MKILNIILIIMLALPGVSMAHGSKVELVAGATTVALEKFSVEEPDETVDAFNAVKSWVSGSKIKVKAYYDSNAKNIAYVCEMKHEGEKEEMVCVK